MVVVVVIAEFAQLILVAGTRFCKFSIRGNETSSFLGGRDGVFMCKEAIF